MGTKSWTLAAAFAFFCGLACADDTTPPDPNAQAKSDIALQQAEVDLQKSRMDLLNTAIPKSGQTGAVDLKDDAGLLESNILAAEALRPIATEIVQQIDVPAGSNPVAIFTSSDKLDFSSIDLFNQQVDAVTSAFKKVDTACASRQGGRHESIAFSGGTLTTAGLVLSALSYLKTDYQVGGTTIAPDETLLTAAVVQAANRVKKNFFQPAQLPSAGASDAIAKSLSELTLLYDASERYLKKDTKPQNSTKGALDTCADETKNARAGYEAFFSSLAASPDKSPLSLATVMRQNAISSAMGENGFGLFVHMQSAAGGHYTKKNFWTYFGGMPFYVSGGAVVSYVLVARKTGRSEAANILTSACGYRRANDVAGHDADAFQCRLIGGKSSDPSHCPDDWKTSCPAEDLRRGH